MASIEDLERLLWHDAAQRGHAFAEHMADSVDGELAAEIAAASPEIESLLQQACEDDWTSWVADNPDARANGARADLVPKVWHDSWRIEFWDTFGRDELLNELAASTEITDDVVEHEARAALRTSWNERDEADRAQLREGVRRSIEIARAWGARGLDRMAELNRIDGFVALDRSRRHAVLAAACDEHYFDWKRGTTGIAVSDLVMVPLWRRHWHRAFYRALDERRPGWMDEARLTDSIPDW